MKALIYRSFGDADVREWAAEWPRPEECDDLFLLAEEFLEDPERLDPPRFTPELCFEERPPPPRLPPPPPSRRRYVLVISNIAR